MTASAATAAATTATAAAARRSAGIAVAACAAALLAPGEARADWERAARRAQGGAWLHYEASGLTLLAEPAAGEPAPRAHELVLAGVRLHGFLSTNRTIAYHVGLDLAAGATLRGGGFAYDVAVFPVGAVLRVGRTSFLGVGAGVGASGATGTLDDAATFPVELTGELGGGVRLLARARVAFVAGADGRRGGAPSAPIGDELDAMIGLRVGRSDRSFGFPTGNGYFFGASYRELAGARYLGLTIGYSIDMATPRR